MCDATQRIAPVYMQLPTANRLEAIYRERVYTYELYHQMRDALAADAELRQYMFSGELDKSGHAIIRVPTRNNKKGWRSCIPDFVLHSPGDMASNIAVVEVKLANGEETGIAKDIDTLAYFVTEDVGYRIGIELAYGGSQGHIETFVRAVRAINNQKIQLYWHPQGERARRII